MINLYNMEKNAEGEEFIYKLPFVCVCTLINEDALILNEDALAHAVTVTSRHTPSRMIRRFLCSTTTDRLHTLLPTRHSGTEPPQHKGIGHTRCAREILFLFILLTCNHTNRTKGPVRGVLSLLVSPLFQHSE